MLIDVSATVISVDILGNGEVVLVTSAVIALEFMVEAACAVEVLAVTMIGGKSDIAEINASGLAVLTIALKFAVLALL